MTDGNTHAIAQHLDEREDWDALQEVTAELEQAEAVTERYRNKWLEAEEHIEELVTKLKAKEKLMLDLAGDKIDLVSELAGVNGKLAKAVDMALEECPFRWGTGGYNDWWHDRRTTLAELKGQDDEH